MKYFEKMDVSREYLRIREKPHNTFFGKIYSDSQDRTIKQLGLKNN